MADLTTHMSREEYNQYLQSLIRKKNKYRSEKRQEFGRTFDSKKESGRYEELLWLLKAGKIKDLQTQVPFELIPNQKDENGRVRERSVKYIADFVYTDAQTGERVVEDTKGMKTKDYIIKRKLMLYVHGIRIREI